MKFEDKPYLKKSPSVRGLKASNLIRDIHKLYNPPTTPRIPTLRTVKIWEFATQISTRFTTPPPPKETELLKLPGSEPGESIILYKIVGEGKDPLDIQMFSIRYPINVALDKVSLQRNDKWKGENEYWWNVVNSHNAADLSKEKWLT